MGTRRRDRGLRRHRRGDPAWSPPDQGGYIWGRPYNVEEPD